MKSPIVYLCLLLAYSVCLAHASANRFVPTPTSQQSPLLLAVESDADQDVSRPTHKIVSATCAAETQAEFHGEVSAFTCPDTWRLECDVHGSRGPPSRAS